MASAAHDRFRPIYVALMIAALSPPLHRAAAQDAQPSAAPAPADTSHEQMLTQAVTALIADAKSLDKFKLEGPGPHLSRPFGQLTNWSGEMAPLVLKRMLEPFTGDPYRDTYIRWHLMAVIKRTPKSQYGPMAPALRKLVDRMPPRLVKEHLPEWMADPPEAWERYRTLQRQAELAVGIPPFEKYYGPPQSYQFMTPQRRAEAEKALAEAQKLQGTFVYRNLPENIAFNRRIGFINWLIRQYRGELVEAIVWTGDEPLLRQLFKVIDRRARQRDGIAVDLVNYLYIAGFDGAFEQYAADVRNDLSRKIKSTARATEGWEEYGGQQRNFADYAFHLVHVLREDTYAGQSDPPAESPDPAEREDDDKENAPQAKAS